MSKKHAAIVIVSILAIVGAPVAATIALATGYFLRFLTLTIPVGMLVVLHLWANHDFYALPLSYRQRGLNRKNGKEREQKALLYKARECRNLAQTYRNRNEPYQAEILEAQADANEREAAMREEDAQRIQRELEDRKMRELTR